MIKPLAHYLRRRLRLLTGQEIQLRADGSTATEFHGSAYGGWSLVRDSLSPSSIVYSFGIGEDASFDLSVIDRFACIVHAFDPTPRSLAWVAAQIHEDRFKMHPWALGDSDGPLRLFLPRNTEHVSASLHPSPLMSADYFEGECYRLSTVMQKLDHRHLDVLKMDIEGSEYGVLTELCLSGQIRCVDQLLVEFHHWMPGLAVDRTKDSVAQLRQAGFRLLWVSPRGHEVLFRRQ